MRIVRENIYMFNLDVCQGIMKFKAVLLRIVILLD